MRKTVWTYVQTYSSKIPIEARIERNQTSERPTTIRVAARPDLKHAPVAFPTADSSQVGASLGTSNSGDDPASPASPPLKRVPSAPAMSAMTAAVALPPDATPASPILSSRPPNVAGAAEAPSRAGVPDHARSAHTKLQGCSTIKLSPLVGLDCKGGSDIDELGDDDGREKGGDSSTGGGNSDGFGRGLLVTSVSECSSSGGGGGQGYFGTEESFDEEDDDDDEDDEGEVEEEEDVVDVANRRGSAYDDRSKRNQSVVSQQLMELADTVASDVTMGGSPTHSNLIQRMAVVSVISGSCRGRSFMSVGVLRVVVDRTGGADDKKYCSVLSSPFFGHK